MTIPPFALLEQTSEGTSARMLHLLGITGFRSILLDSSGNCESLGAARLGFLLACYGRCPMLVLFLVAKPVFIALNDARDTRVA